MRNSPDYILKKSFPKFSQLIIYFKNFDFSSIESIKNTNISDAFALFALR